MSTQSAIRARSEWLAHLRYCTQCPTDLCDRGTELAAAVEETMSPDETWMGIYRPRSLVIVPHDGGTDYCASISGGCPIHHG